MPEILMPKLSDSMEQGTILTWLKATGDAVEIGDEMLEIETDKSTVTYAAEEAGVLETLVEEGTTIAVGEPIARIGDRADGARVDAAASREPVVATTKSPRTRTNGHGRGLSAATPLARRTATVYGIELESIQGTGPLGRVTRADVLKSADIDLGEAAAPPAASAAAPAVAAASPESPASAASPPSTTVIPARGVIRREPSRLQHLIARRMAEAKATIPHFQVQTEVAMDRAISLRSELKQITDEADTAPSLNDFIVKASALALKEHPLANGSFQDEAFILHERVNVGVAVAADEALVVPTVFDADVKTLKQIAEETRVLASRVRDGKISPPELEGGTFTVSNLGMFGMTAITPVINAPQAAILGVGALRATLERVDGEIVDRTLMALTLSCDHRILYGAEASRFLARIRELLETPLKLAF